MSVFVLAVIYLYPLHLFPKHQNQKQMEWLTNQFQGNASVEDSLVYGISRAARKACAGITFILFSFAASAQTAEQSIELGEVEVKGCTDCS